MMLYKYDSYEFVCKDLGWNGSWPIWIKYRQILNGWKRIGIRNKLVNTIKFNKNIFMSKFKEKKTNTMTNKIFLR